MKNLLLAALFLSSSHVSGQSYAEDILRHRQAYKEEFTTDANSPLTAADTGYLRFYEPNPQYRFMADFKLTPDSPKFDMATHSGKLKPYRQYGVATFTMDGKAQKVHIYQGLDLIKQEQYKDHLFIPFNDGTNYNGTYAGGRYLDLKTSDIKDGKVIIDFNKCYNPYCAYKDGYSCPIPPDENHLKASIPAGEMMFGRKEEE